MPKEIVVVRHAYCIGEEAKLASEKGDDGFFTPKFRVTDSKTWSLVPIGKDQARFAGEKIRESIATEFDHYLCTDTVRTLETAHYLRFPNADWKIDSFLRGRDWNGFENVPISERKERCVTAGIPYHEDSIAWHPPGGESMLVVVDSVRSFLERACREYEGEKLLIVTHGSPAQALRLIQHRVPQSGYLDFISQKGYIRNCQISRYHQKNGICGGVPLYEFEQLFLLNGNGKWDETTERLAINEAL